MSGDFILVVNLGGNQAQATARMLRGDQIFSLVATPRLAVREMKKPDCRGILLVGTGGDDQRIEPLLEGDKPVLALDGAAEALLTALGGEASEPRLEKSAAPVQFLESELFEEISGAERYFDRCCAMNLTEGCVPIAWAGEELPAAFAWADKKIYALQFLVETNDPDGLTILSNFARRICGCSPWWTLSAFADEALSAIRERVGEKSALVVISGGVDSMVCASLVHHAIGKNLKCVYVDNGLKRAGEIEKISAMFAEKPEVEFRCVDARERVLSRLRGITDAAAKRRAAADETLRAVAEEAEKMEKVDFLIQGTIYPDVISAASSDNDPAADRSTLEDFLRFEQLLEPIRMLFKDEVRRLGILLGLPEWLVYRPPFPEAGFAVRCIGEVTAEKLDMLSRADSIFCGEIASAGLDKRVWQYFAVLTDTVSPGFRDGKAVPGYVLALRAVNAKDSSSATSCRLPYDLLERTAERITGEIPGISRVVFDITGKPPAMIEWE